MNILFVCENYLPHYGGAEVVFKNLAEGFVQQGHKVTLITRRLHGTKKKETINGVNVIRVRSANTRYLFSLAAIPLVWKWARWADVIQTTTFNGAPPAWIGAKLRGKNVILTVHEVWINKWRKVTDFGRISCWIHNCLEKMIYWLPFDKYVCVSDATRHDLLKIGIDPRKAITIHNGFDSHFWNEKNFDGTDVRNKYNLADKFTAFSWGRPGPSKGFEYLLQAVPKIVEKIPQFTLLLMLSSVDKYPQKYRALQQMIENLNIQETVILVPAVPYDQLGNYLIAADCLVVPSIAEGFGYNVLEGVSVGKPMVTTTVGSIPEVIGG
ncbi:MAG: hypothetical protein A3A85_05300, partial [Deltaproteobacteria bacterium RIFCSPLOWO2_01_FULL_42_9]